MNLLSKITVLIGLIFTLLISSNLNKINVSGEDQHSTSVEIMALHDHEENLHLFDMSTNKVSSGWTTFTFTNASDSDHFVVMYKVPEVAIAAAEESGEELLDYWFNAITVPFQEEYNQLADGTVDYNTFVNNLVKSISNEGAWFFEPGAPPYGGPGFTSAGLTSETTVYMDPGSYVIECYVKDDDETFHSYIGMLEMLTVTDEVSDESKPDSRTIVNISSESGISVDGDLLPGIQTIEIYFEDQIAHEHLLGHNVQLIKMVDDENQNLLADVATWMDWRKPGSLVNRAPQNVQLLGGAMEMTAGSRAYYQVNLRPGDYVWIAEVPNPEEKNMVYRFSIPE